MKYFILAKYKSKYGLILYAVKVQDGSEPDIDLNNVYILTLYFKGSSEISINKVYDLQTVKGENGFTYAFL